MKRRIGTAAGPLLAVIVVAALVAQPAQAQLGSGIGIGLRASTLGAGAELSFRRSMVAVRVGGSYFTVTRNTTIEGIDYDLKPKLRNATAIVDLHPLRSALHVSGGLVWNGNEGGVVARLTGPITIGNTTYQPDEVGSLTGVVKYRSKVVPYLGLGFSGQGRVSLLFDAGVVLSDYPRAELTGTTSLTGQAKVVFDQNVQQEIQDIQAEIESHSYLKYYPVVSVGIRVGL